MNECTFEPRSRFSVYVESALELSISVGVAVLAIFALKAPTDIYILLGELVACYMLVVLLGRTSMRFRYGDSLDRAYKLDWRGLTINGPQGSKYLTWDKFTRVEYMPVIPLFRLYSPLLPKPVVLFAIGRWTAQRLDNWRVKEAKELLRQGLRQNFKVRWLPW